MSEERWEISVLVGPCSMAEVERFLDDIVREHRDRLGAAYAITRWREDDEDLHASRAGLSQPENTQP